jgi:hypothetical protein
MRLESKEVEAVEKTRQVRDGLIVLVKENGEIRQISTKTIKKVDKSNEKR